MMNSLWLRSVRPVLNRALTQEFSKRTWYSLSIASINSTNYKLTTANVRNTYYNINRYKSQKVCNCF